MKEEETRVKEWWRWRVSNPRPAAYESAALPTELHRHVWCFNRLALGQEIEDTLSVHRVSTGFGCMLGLMVSQQPPPSIDQVFPPNDMIPPIH